MCTQERRAEDRAVTENPEEKKYPILPKISFSHLNMKLLH